MRTATPWELTNSAMLTSLRNEVRIQPVDGGDLALEPASKIDPTRLNH
ncbi:hypothetical protein ACI6Q5_01460 [Xanthomonas codiaei]|uniref:Uncharacterized protein n=1 Tax=Xanthomonas codiaei TaxID=56463 RepID=A0ABW9MG77_9XANT|nr:hypothetical protein [Xanthomonas codiaei]MCC8537524.1 hypothetical protein [Xanthomonas codiaei]